MELLINTFESAVHEVDRPGIGAVISVQEDGYAWSSNERQEFFVIRLPDDALEASGWANIASPQIARRLDPVLNEHEDVVLRERRYLFDLDVLTPERKAYFLDRINDHGITEGELSIRNLIDLEARSPRFEIGDLITSGGPVQ